MFLAGLDVNPHQFRRQRRHTLLFGFATFAIPQVLGALLARFLMGFSWPAAILLASLFASHTLVPYPIVSQLGLGRNRAVNTAIGGTIMTDTAALLVLAVVAETTVRGLSGAFLIRQMILLALLLLIVLWGLRRVGYAFFRLATPDGVTEFIFVLASVFVSSYLATLAGVEPIIGAFFAGLALSPLIPDTSPLHNRLEFTGKAIFIPFFLLSVGMLVNIEAFMSGFRGWAMALMMTGTVVSTKWSAAWLSGRVLGYSRDEIRLLFGKPATKERGRLIKAIKDLQSRHGLIVQALDARLVVSERHIRFAVQKALSAFSDGRNIANDAAMEIMRYASGERQIERALVMGVSDQTGRIGLIMAKTDGKASWPDDREICQIIEDDGCGCSFDPVAVKDIFHISSLELEAVGEERIEDLVIERVALVETYR